MVSGSYTALFKKGEPLVLNSKKKSIKGHSRHCKYNQPIFPNEGCVSHLTLLNGPRSGLCCHSQLHHVSPMPLWIPQDFLPSGPQIVELVPLYTF